MQKYREINGNDYVKDSRATINETMQSIQSMNSGTAFPTTNLFEGMKCYRTDLKKTYTLTDVENNTWVEDAHATLSDEATHATLSDEATHATLSDEATHAASATKLQTARSLNLGGAVTADAATFDGTANATINVKTLDATKLKGTASVSTTGNAATATKVVTTAASGASANIAEATMASSDYARIRVSGNDNAGELALETADNGDEPIVARQYTGIYATPVRTAKILDENGNTSFPGTVVAPKFTGTLNGNAATATKLQTPRTISLTGNATGSASFDGSGDISISTTVLQADNADTVDGVHAASLFYNKGAWNEDIWATIGTYQVNGNPPASDAYGWGQVISSSTNNGRFQLYASDSYGGNGRLHYRTGWDSNKHRWNTILDSENYNSFAPTKIGSGASGTWGINISGNAATATTANALNGIINREPATNNHAIIPGASARDYCEFHEFGAVWNFIKTSNEGSTTVASIRSDGFHGNVVGNADTATNADTVDGYHASDLFRHLGGNQTPVITDIFDRAGTIDMTTMSAADKATHKANINKAPNMIQNIWNNGTGIHAYGGDIDMSGYSCGTLKLTQSWRNFDKLMILYTDDDGEFGRVRTFDVYEFNYCMTSMHSFNILLDDSQSWHVFGLTKHGTDSSFIPSTETILSCRGQNCGIIGIYGIKF